MKKLILFAASALLSVGVMAQTDGEKKEKKTSKFGSFVRKNIESSTGLNVSNETFVKYDERGFVKDRMDVEFAGCYGNSNTHEVYLVLKVKCKGSDRVYLGTTKATTAKGKIYQTGSSNAGYDNYDVAQNLFVEVSLEKTSLQGVPTDVTNFEVVYFNTAGYDFTIHNVPIQWDVTPE